MCLFYQPSEDSFFAYIFWPKKWFEWEFGASLDMKPVLQELCSHTNLNWRFASGWLTLHLGFPISESEELIEPASQGCGKIRWAMGPAISSNHSLCVSCCHYCCWRWCYYSHRRLWGQMSFVPIDSSPQILLGKQLPLLLSQVTARSRHQSITWMIGAAAMREMLRESEVITEGDNTERGVISEKLTPGL